MGHELDEFSRIFALFVKIRSIRVPFCRYLCCKRFINFLKPLIFNMISILKKEIQSFFGSLTGYVVIGVFLLITGLMLWVFPDYSLLNYQFATLDSLFEIAPAVFLFLIPAVTMRSFAEEKQTGTLELLVTRPLRDYELILGKYLSAWLLVIIALIPTLLYYGTIYQLGSPKGNLDSGAILGSYIGLAMLGGVFAAIGIFASALTNNQIVAFLLAMFLGFMVHYGFLFLSKLPIFFGSGDDLVQMLGLDYHYQSISRGIIDLADTVYFLSVIFFFLFLTQNILQRANR
jgi:ABC-2 type transport system permease protein